MLPYLVIFTSISGENEEHALPRQTSPLQAVVFEMLSEMFEMLSAIRWTRARSLLFLHFLLLLLRASNRVYSDKVEVEFLEEVEEVF